MKQVIRKEIKEKHGVTDDKPIYTLLIDGNSLMKRSLVDKRMNDKGEEYGMVLQSIYKIRSVLTTYDFNHVYFFYDSEKSGILRYYLLPEYKENRDKNYNGSQDSEYYKKLDAYASKVLAYSRTHKKEVKRGETEEESFERQKNILLDILENLFVRTCGFPEVEGDDLIAYYVSRKKPNEKIVIMSGDRDITQLIRDDVAVYVIDKKMFVSPKNFKKVFGYCHENVALLKTFIGDTSDNIKGIKGVGEKSFLSAFPEAMERKVGIDDIVEHARLINEERVKEKKKPLKMLSNIIDKVSDSSQGDKIYETNWKVIDLTHPLMTEEAIEGMESYIGAPLDAEGRDYTNIYNIISENGMVDMMDESKFGDFFGCFGRLIDNEKNYQGDD